MKKIYYLFTAFLLLSLNSNSCFNSDLIYEAVSNYSDFGSPEQAYIQLTRRFFINSSHGQIEIASESAGGVCVFNENSGCFVITVNHFCNTNNRSQNIQFPEISENISAENITGEISYEIQIIDTISDADLCLLMVENLSVPSVRGIVLTENVPRFSPLQNFGAPAGHFSSLIDAWNLSMYEGRWSGYCTDRCIIPESSVKYENLITHTIPTTRGQSGSPIFIGDFLFAIQVASNNYIEDFGLATNSKVIYLFLIKNGIYLEEVEL